MLWFCQAGEDARGSEHSIASWVIFTFSTRAHVPFMPFEPLAPALSADIPEIAREEMRRRLHDPSLILVDVPTYGQDEW